MLIDIINPSTKLNDVYSELWSKCESLGGLTFTTERCGHIVCHGKLQDKVARCFAPIHSSEGDAYMCAEILCMVNLLNQLGQNIEFSGKEVKIITPKLPKSKIDRAFLKNSSSLSDCLRRLEDTGYDMVQLTDYLDSLRNEGRRVNKYDVVEFVFKEVKIEPIQDRKPLRSGAEWMRVKALADGKNLPHGFNSADEFATFATKEQIDGIEHENN